MGPVNEPIFDRNENNFIREGWGGKRWEEKGRRGIGREGGGGKGKERDWERRGGGGQTQSRASVQLSRAGTLSCHVYIPTNELDFRCFFLPRRVKHF